MIDQEQKQKQSQSQFENNDLLFKRKTTKHHGLYLTAFGVTPPPRNVATSAQNDPCLLKLTVLPMARRRRMRSDSPSQPFRVDDIV
jgi:hypothetical protein